MNKTIRLLEISYYNSSHFTSFNLHKKSQLVTIRYKSVYVHHLRSADGNFRKCSARLFATTRFHLKNLYTNISHIWYVCVICAHDNKQRDPSA